MIIYKCQNLMMKLFEEKMERHCQKRVLELIRINAHSEKKGGWIFFE
jgi:hypothetical protein